MTTAPGPLKGDAAIWRRVVEQTAEDCKRIAFWAAASRGTSMVMRWQSVEQRERAMIARMRARQLAEATKQLRADFARLREQCARNNGSSPSTNRPVSCPQVAATR